MRTTLEAMRLALVDFDGLSAADAIMPCSGSWLLAPLGNIWLGVDRHHAGWRRRRRLLAATSVFEFGDAAARRQQRERDDFRTKFGELSRVCLGQFTA
jgi:hypothetical protein